MLYLVEQYGTVLFVVKKISGYKQPCIYGTRISEEEFSKLFNSNPLKREKLHGLNRFGTCLGKGLTGSIEQYRIYGDARKILGRNDIVVINCAGRER